MAVQGSKNSIVSTSAEEKKLDEFLLLENPPSDLSVHAERVQQFIERHSKENRVTVLVTSGGTLVALERNAVRFISNFSSGARGSTSAEWFLKQGCAVVFLHRADSKEPYLRRFTAGQLCDWTQRLQDGTWKVSPPAHLADRLGETLSAYHDCCERDLLLTVSYSTVSHYLFFLREFARVCCPFKSAVIFYLAAAVSDFYVPKKDMPEHKIQSTDTLSLSLCKVPKALKCLIKDWAPEAFFVTWKLETDPLLLLEKAQQSLATNRQHVVLGNVLATKTTEVMLLTNKGHRTLLLSDHPNIDEIEQIIISAVLEEYKLFLHNAQS